MNWPLLRSLVLTIAGCLWGLVGRAQSEDHLEPVPGYFAYSEPAAYIKALQPLHEGLGNYPLARLLVRPSSSPEYVLSVDRTAGTYYLTCHISQRSLWAAVQDTAAPAVPVTRHAVALPPEAATLLGDLFSAAIAQTRYPAPKGSIRGDGTTYTFLTFQNGIGFRQGQTWSPRIGTRMGVLVALTDRLKRVALAPSGQPFPPDLLYQARQLTERLQAK